MISSGTPHVRPVGRTCGELDETELTAMGVELNGVRRVLDGDGDPLGAGVWDGERGLWRRGGGKVAVLGDRAWSRMRTRAVISLGWVFFDFDFVRRPGTARTMHPHVGPQYVRGARRNRIDPHGGGIERLGTVPMLEGAVIMTGACSGVAWKRGR